MPTRRSYLQGVAALGGIGSLSYVADRGSGATKTFSSFVDRDGTQFTLDGAPFYFNGANAPWLTHTYPSKDTVDAVMAFANDLDIDVLRTGIHSVDVGGVVHSPEPGELGEEAFQHVDYILQQAEQHGIRMVFSLVDNWDYYGGMAAYVSNSPTASQHDDFYTDAQCREWYRTYVEKVLTRKNTLTGRVYRDDPTVLMWELANEAEAKQAGIDPLQSWTEEMAAHFKSLDGNHLVSTGSGGNFNRDSNVWEYSGGNGVDFVQNHSIPEVDVCSFHLYPEWLNENTNAYGKQWIRDHVTDAHDTIGKPVFMGEFGWAAGRSPDRASVYSDWFGLLDEHDAAGAATWQLVKENRSETSKHDIRRNDTATTNVLDDFSATQTAKRGSSSSGGGSGGTATDTSSLAGERLDVTGAGADIWNQYDEFHYAHERVSGDATLAANVTAQDDTHWWAKAGLMVRGSTAPDAAHAMIVVTPDNGVAFQYRTDAGGWSSSTGASGSVPQRLKLERRGDTVTGYAERNGSWTEVGSATIPVTEPHLGLAVTSHRAGTASTARFENITGQTDSRLSAWTNEDVGSVDVAGSVSSVDAAGPTVEAGNATVDDTSATLTGDLSALGGADSATVYFEWGPVGDGFPNVTATRALDATGSFNETVSGLATGTRYEFRAVAETAAGSDRSAATQFQAATSPPVVDDLVAAGYESSSGGQYWVSWSVTDPSGDLSVVTVELLDGNGSVVADATTQVNGANHGGSDAFSTSGSVSQYRLTVVDAAGNETTDTRDITQ
ncbi:glycoside hydrolase family 2 TIM barrel-domain containing protein [Halobacterium zhouii]|uniref:glycoside hydrolase family 2 TIM barrel-domain containing protein n=1 Tax=Halobacterium zhouii TaxID=2902624 RepID=UPI001E436E5E|nr:glycoside hydrolase family 2 TIM barrel-domain containing protein [Halobacterium zhouii]